MSKKFKGYVGTGMITLKKPRFTGGKKDRKSQKELASRNMTRSFKKSKFNKVDTTTYYPNRTKNEKKQEEDRDK